MADNIKCAEYLHDVGRDDWIVDPEPSEVRKKLEEVMLQEPYDTRSKIRGLWDEQTYAKRIEKILQEII